MVRATALLAGPLPLVLLVGFLLPASALAGNREMVEKAVKDLDELNRQAISELPALPSDGKIKISSEVIYRQGNPIFTIFQQEIRKTKSPEVQKAAPAADRLKPEGAQHDPEK